MTGKRILVVDDEQSILTSISMLLETRGYTVQQANSGDLALELMAVDEFDCLLLDYSMPKMNGMQVLQKIREQDILTPVVLCSGFSNSIVESRYHFQPEKTLGKPYSFDVLCQNIEEACSQVISGQGNT